MAILGLPKPDNLADPQASLPSQVTGILADLPMPARVSLLTMQLGARPTTDVLHERWRL